MNIVDTLGFSYTDRLAPVALLLRSGEAVDAVMNFVDSGANASSAGEAAGYVLCGLMQVSLILYLCIHTVVLHPVLHRVQPNRLFFKCTASMWTFNCPFWLYHLKQMWH